MTTFSRATVTIATIYGPQEVAAMVRGGLAVHGSTGLYTVTHIATGKAICHTDQQRTAKGVAIEVLEAYPRIGQECPPPQMMASLRYFLDELKIAKPAPKPKPLVAPPLELEPIYPEYFAPSEELRALDNSIAKGLTGGVVEGGADVGGHRHGDRTGDIVAPTAVDGVAHSQGDAGIRGMVQAASGLEQRELIMVRMGTGKQAVLLDKDIPPQPRTTPLPAHIPPGYAGVKQLTQQMWKLGKEIDEQAYLMVEYYQRGGPFGQNEFRWWLEQDDELSDLIKRGWCDWAVCVTLFATLTKEEQAKITDVLGFVGSEEQGWVAYGKKTFLRSKRLVELTECRRAVAAALNG